MNIKLHHNKLIIVEGSSDKAFFLALLSNRNIDGIDVLCPWDLGTKLEGEDSIVKVLESIPLDRKFDELIKILIVVDSDSDPNAKFIKFQNILNNMQNISGRDRKYPTPINPCEFSTFNTLPNIAIMLLPSSNTNGAMETLCIEAALPNHQLKFNCIDTFANCISANNWQPQKLSKLRLRALISSLNQQNPDLPTTKLWEVAPNIVPLNSNVFDPLVEFLLSM